MEGTNPSPSVEQTNTRRRTRPRRANLVGSMNDGAESDDSMPSLQTVSDSSEGESEYGDVDGGGDSDTEPEEEEEFDSDSDDLPPLAPVNNANNNNLPRRNAPPRTADPVADAVAAEGGRRISALFRSFAQLSSSAQFGGFRMGHPMQTDDMRAFRAMFPDFPHLHSPFEDDVPPHTHNEPDPKRAEIIMAGFEVIPDNLFSRYQTLRIGKSNEFDGCTICQEDFLICAERDLMADTLAPFAELPYSQYQPPVVLAFPCPGMHLYHDRCISPWLSRKTTCPSCRFDIDPESLTLSCARVVSHSKKWEPPKNIGFISWLQREEGKQGKSHDQLSLADLPPLARYGDIAPFVSHSEDENDDWVTDDEEEEGGDTDEESYNPSIAEGSVWNLMSNTPFGENAPRADPSHPDSQLMSDAFGLVNAMFSGLRAQNLNVNNVDMSSDDDDEAPPPLMPARPSGSNSQPRAPFYYYENDGNVIHSIGDPPDDMPELSSPISPYETSEQIRRWHANVEENDESDDDLEPLALPNRWRRRLFSAAGTDSSDPNIRTGFPLAHPPTIYSSRTAGEERVGDDTDSDDLPPL